jgi:hypothetical protein
MTKKLTLLSQPDDGSGDAIKTVSPEERVAKEAGQRRAQALRANLARRKAQQRERSANNSKENAANEHSGE